MRQTKAFTLRTYPFREADRVVILFSEELGILRGVARGSLKIKSKITGTLEPLTLVNLRYVEPHGRDLVVITGSDSIRSLYNHLNDLDTFVAISLITEITLESHADRDPNFPMFRLLELVQKALRKGVDARMVMHYFELFTLKLTGVLPPPTEIRVPRARQLMREMLKTNLLNIPLPEGDDLAQLGIYLRREIRNAMGKRLRSYDFIDQIKTVGRAVK